MDDSNFLVEIGNCLSKRNTAINISLQKIRKRCTADNVNSGEQPSFGSQIQLGKLKTFWEM